MFTNHNLSIICGLWTGERRVGTSRLPACKTSDPARSGLVDQYQARKRGRPMADQTGRTSTLGEVRYRSPRCCDQEPMNSARRVIRLFRSIDWSVRLWTEHRLLAVRCVNHRTPSAEAHDVCEVPSVVMSLIPHHSRSLPTEFPRCADGPHSTRHAHVGMANCPDLSTCHMPRSRRRL
jgi:hypothetical protein